MSIFNGVAAREFLPVLPSDLDGTITPETAETGFAKSDEPTFAKLGQASLSAGQDFAASEVPPRPVPPYDQEGMLRLVNAVLDK